MQGLQVLKPISILAATIIGGVLVVKYMTDGPTKNSASVQSSPSNVVKKLEAPTGFSALGQLEPVGRIRDLAAPTLATDVQPRIASVLVEEGQYVSKGQLLALFDTNERLITQRDAILERLAAVNDQLKVLEKETSRFRQLAAQNAYPRSDLESKELRLLDLKAEAIIIRSELKTNEVETKLSRLTSPIAGKVLQINARAGERPNPFGLIKVGETNQMMAIIQVNEEYIRRVSLGETVRLRSENKSFPGFVSGRVSHISPIVSNRKSLSVDPKVEADKEARVINVEVTIDGQTSKKLQNLTGAKVIAIFKG